MQVSIHFICFVLVHTLVKAQKMLNLGCSKTFVGFKTHARPGGGLPYETDGDARWKIRIKPLKETNLGVAQALFEP